MNLLLARMQTGSKKRLKEVALAPSALALLSPSAAIAADGYWLDQYNALLFMVLLRLDPELSELHQADAHVVVVHAENLPDVLLCCAVLGCMHARRAALTPVAWIHRPTAGNLKRVGALAGYQALHVDDHFFADLSVSISKLKAGLSS